MPKAAVTVRYKSFGDDEPYNNQLKQKQRQEVLKNYPGVEIVSQQVITDGIPDAVKFGDLRSQGQVAIRTTFMVTEEQAERMKAGRRI